MLLEVAVKTPLRKLFTYESDRPLAKGVRVKVPFRSREVTGFVWGESKEQPKGLKSILEVFDQEPLLDERNLHFYEKASQYYGISLGELLGSAFPKSVRDGKAVIPPPLKQFVPQLVQLTEAQQKIANSISESKGYEPHLLMGDTGSGKTEIYLHAIEQVLARGGQALFLVPEISLTPQLLQRLSDRLGNKISVFHSQLSEKKRSEAFARALMGHSDLFLGARSALFLPFSKLELIVVDEEHDSSYKQSERGTYNARDLSLLRAQLFQIPLVLGSATPSLESFSRTNQKVYRLEPFFRKQEPDLTILDLKKAWKSGPKSFLTNELHEAVTATLEKKEQVLLFLNRRGSASQRLCLGCGSVDECKQCSVNMTIHTDLGKAICHWCGFQKILKPQCDTCGSKEFFFGGMGTKELEIQIKNRFPEARIARLDRDEAQKKNVLDQVLMDFAAGKIDILIGTQMISKGIDIPKLSMVGVVLADQGWGIPDYRATERSFQLLRQLMGRAGRRGQRANVLIQTFSPEHPIFEWLKAPSPFDAFVGPELELRKLAQLPPFARMTLCTISHKEEAIANSSAAQLFSRIEASSKAMGIQLIGPVAAPLARWKGVFRVHILAKADLKAPMSSFCTAVLDDLELRPLEAKVRLDRDPYQFM